MLRSLLVRVSPFLLALFTTCANALDLTDIWYSPTESGWGVNIVQANDFLFLSFFLYDENTMPTWYSGQLSFDGTRYSGGLYASRGSYWAGTWNPAQHPPAALVGNASVTLLGPYDAVLRYTVTGFPEKTKNITRGNIIPITMTGTYVGGQAGGYTSCNVASMNQAYDERFTLTVTQASTTQATLKFSYEILAAACTISGTLEQHGQLYRMNNADYSCTGGLTFTTKAAVDELKVTSQGIEGRFTANVGQGCTERASFSAVLRQR
jgi:hypothetical protein